MYQDSQDQPETLGRFQLLDKIATGGMGEIYLGRILAEGGFEKLIVLKLLLPELVADERFVAMFLDEARLTAKLSHPNVCEVYELGKADNRYFIAMPYLRGVPLSRLIGGGDVDVAMAVGLLVQACAGLHHAHELRDNEGELIGLVHRDVSPSNLFVTVDGVVKVLDFGIAKARGASTKTAKNEIKGKYAYMSPEQLRGEPLDRRSDVFSLGIVAHELLTGERLFRRASDFLAAKAILEEPIETVRSLRGDVPKALSAAVERALCRERDERFDTVADFGAALASAVAPMPAGAVAATVRERFATHLRERDSTYERATDLARSRVSTGASTNRFGTATTRALGGTRQPRARRSLLPWALAVLVAGGASAAIWWATGSASSSPSSVPADAALKVAAAPIDARTADAAAAPIDAAPPAAPPTAPKRAKRPPKRSTPKQRKVGFLSVDSDPYAVIYVDGRRLGVTPLIRKAVPAGRRTIRAVTKSGKSRTFHVTIRAGRAAPPQQLRW